MSVRVAIGVGVLLGAVISVTAFEVCNEFEVNLFHIGDTA